MKKAPLQLIAIVAVLLLAALACESSETPANNQPSAGDLQQDSINEDVETDPEATQTIEILPTTAYEEATQDPSENQPEESADIGAAIGVYILL